MTKAVVAPLAAQDSGHVETLLTLPLRFEDRLSRASQIVRLAIVLPAAVLLIGAVIAGLASLDRLLAGLLSSPVSLLQLIAGFAICAILFVMPAARLLYNFGRRRDVTIDNGIVAVRERAPWRDTSRSVRLADFDGIAHLVQTTSSGPCHKLVLVHREKALSVAIHAADRIGPHTIANACAVLGLNEIAARDMRRKRHVSLAATVDPTGQAVAPLAA